MPGLRLSSVINLIMVAPTRAKASKVHVTGSLNGAPRGQHRIACKHVLDRAVGQLFYKPLEQIKGCRREVLLYTDASHQRGDSRPVIGVVSSRHALIAPLRPVIGGLNLDNGAEHRNGTTADEVDAINEIVDRGMSIRRHSPHVGHAVDQRGRDTEGDAHQGTGDRIERARCMHAGITGFEGIHADTDGADGRIAEFPICSGKTRRSSGTERIVTTAGLVGTTELAIKLAIKLAVDYARQRKVFGATPIAAYQGLQFPLAQAHAQNESARIMNYKAAANCDSGRAYGSEANVAKLLAAQAAALATERSMQTMGGMGYAKEFDVERLWRDARLFRFAPVSEEMIRSYIAVHDLGIVRSY